MKFYQILLFPISLIYAGIISIRNLFFDFGILSSKSFPLPVIVVGNLSTGGTGKTPHIEYLVRLLEKQFSIAVLSRGYGRRSKGFFISDIESTAKIIGDEPLQIKKKYPQITVAVCSSRVEGISKILSQKTVPNAILLDDAFQHRYVKPSLSILLTDYTRLYTSDFILPFGNLRERASEAKRADIIVVTKTPSIFSPLEKRLILEELKPKPHQTVFFSYTSYGKNLVSLNMQKTIPLKVENFSVLLLTGIANGINLEYYLKDKAKNIWHMAYPDHHMYIEKELNQIRNNFDSITKSNKIIITTEKDAMRLMDPTLFETIKDLPIYYLPIEVKFHGNDEAAFNHNILKHVKES
jgi:tetraacyldisaccharide 4'-kinase